MRDLGSGILAMVGACTLWGLSPLFYDQLRHVPPLHILAHRTLWSLVFFALILLFQRRLTEIRGGFLGPKRIGVVALAAAMVSVNWFLFIYAVQIERATEASLGYYIFPLVAVVIGRVVLKEHLSTLQWSAVGLATGGVVILTLGLGAPPWISLTIAVSFAIYGLIKRGLPLGPVVSVACEVLLFLPASLMLIVLGLRNGVSPFGVDLRDTVFLILSGPLTGVPLVLFSIAARRTSMTTLGVLQYINPTLQFLVAALVFAEPLGRVHGLAFPLIWAALAIYSVGLLRQEKRPAA